MIWLQPPNDPYGISKEDLIITLRSCLASTPKFAEFCLPLLIEKLTSSISSAKMDSLHTLVRMQTLEIFH